MCQNNSKIVPLVLVSLGVVPYVIPPFEYGLGWLYVCYPQNMAKLMGCYFCGQAAQNGGFSPLALMKQIALVGSPMGQ